MINIPTLGWQVLEEYICFYSLVLVVLLFFWYLCMEWFSREPKAKKNLMKLWKNLKKRVKNLRNKKPGS